MSSRLLWRRPTGALAFLASAGLVYFVFKSYGSTSQPSTPFSPAFLHPTAFEDDQTSASCPAPQYEGSHACANTLFFPPPPPRQIVPTTLVSHVPGWTLFQNLYFSNGTWFIVSPESPTGEGIWPERRLMISKGLPLAFDNTEEREPGPEDMDLLTPEEAEEVWGDRVFDVEGFSVLANDPNQFLQHYYHVAAELLLGIERICTNFDPMPRADGTISAPYPERIIFLHTDEEGFTDGPGLDKFFLHAQYPQITPLYQPSWEEMAALVQDSRKAWRFPAALMIDRSAAFWGKYTQFTSRPVAGPWALGGGEYGTAGVGRNQYWYEAARRRVLSFVGVSKDVQNIALRALDPPLAPPRSDGKEDVYQVTYISRQRTWNRRLVDEDHARLVNALGEMCRRRGWRFYFMQAEDMTREEQMAVAAETTVFVAVHGNGLTHLLLQPPHPRSAIIELFHPPGFARDYEYITAMLGRRYYNVQNDTVYTAPNLPENQYPDWIIGREIPVQAEVVVRVVEEQLLGEVRGTGHWQSPMEGVGY